MLRQIFFVVSMCLSLSFAEGAQVLLDGITHESVTLAEALSGVVPGSVVVVGEDHGLKPHHDNQRSVLAELLRQGHRVSVGFEFIAASFQDSLDQYLKGEMVEAPFLTNVEWGRINFAHYRPQLHFPLMANGWAIGLNVPRRISGRVRDVGVAGLNDEERTFVPEGFVLGNAGYHRRFKEVMAQIPHPIPPEKIEQMFEAQSLWDDVMAVTAKDYMDAHPEQVLVIHVGNFHAAFGGGLPDRLKARGVRQVMVFSQIDATELDDDQLNDELEPDPEAGPRGDFIWILRSP